MFRSMTKQEFLDWWAFDMIEPIGGTRGDYQSAQMCTAMMNGFAVLARSKKRFKLDDFLFKWGKDFVDAAPASDGKTPWQQMKLVAKMWAASAKADEDKPARTRRERAPKQGRAEQVAAARAALKTNDRRTKG